MNLLRLLVACFFVFGQCSADIVARRYLRDIARNHRFHAIGSPTQLSLFDDSTPKAIAPNDLWGIRDLLLVGYCGVFLTSSGGRQEVKRAAMSLADLLPTLHPHPPCREQIAAALQGVGQERDKILGAAAASWSCLPAKFSSQSFESPFPEDALDDDEDVMYEKAYQARMVYVNDMASLGACKWSTWPRTCSYWVSLHSMAFLADKLELSRKFLQAVVPLLAGGAIMCGGCTKHFNFMHLDVLSSEILRSQGKYF